MDHLLALTDGRAAAQRHAMARAERLRAGPQGLSCVFNEAAGGQCMRAQHRRIFLELHNHTRIA